MSDNHAAPPPTRIRKNSQRTKKEEFRNDLKRRFREHIRREWVPDFEMPKEDQQFDFHYVATFDSFIVIYYCVLTKKGSEESDKIWLLWNGDEVYSTRDEEGSFILCQRCMNMSGRCSGSSSPLLLR